MKSVIAVVLVSQGAGAVSVKSDPLANRGCLPKLQVAEAEAVIKRFNLAVENARPREIQTLGTTLKWIEIMNDNRPLHRAVRQTQYTYNFQTKIGNSRQDPTHAIINRNGAKNYGENVAQLAHELGHLIGNSDSTGNPNPHDSTYIDYVNYMGPRNYCLVSTYADDNSHEQFAEVFAAFVTRPELIKNNPSRACKKAYHFLSTKLFASTSDAAAGRCLRRQTKLSNRAKLPESPASVAVREKAAADEEAKVAREAARAAKAAAQASKPAPVEEKKAEPQADTEAAKPEVKAETKSEAKAEAETAKPETKAEVTTTAASK